MIDLTVLDDRDDHVVEDRSVAEGGGGGLVEGSGWFPLANWVGQGGDHHKLYEGFQSPGCRSVGATIICVQLPAGAWVGRGPLGICKGCLHLINSVRQRITVTYITDSAGCLGRLGFRVAGTIEYDEFATQTRSNLTRARCHTNTSELTTSTFELATNIREPATNTFELATNIRELATSTFELATNSFELATSAFELATTAFELATNVSTCHKTFELATNRFKIATNTRELATNPLGLATNTFELTTNAFELTRNAFELAANTLELATNAFELVTNSLNLP